MDNQSKKPKVMLSLRPSLFLAAVANACLIESCILDETINPKDRFREKNFFRGTKKK